MENPTVNQHKTWLRKKLRENDIDKYYLIGLATVVGRIVYDEKRKQDPYAPKPFYLLYDKEGKPTRAWQYMAELALFCRHKEYRPADYVRSICTMPAIRKRIFLSKDQLPMRFIGTSTRTSAEEIRKLEDHFLKQKFLVESAY